MHRRGNLLLAMVGLLLAGALMACGAPSGPELRVDDVWARPAMAMGEMETGDSAEGGMGMAGTGAVFMLLVNSGGEADRLVGGSTDVAEVVEIHETVVEGDVTKMRMLPDGLAVPAKGEVLLKPGGYHIMLIGLKQDLKPGDRFTLDLEFEKSGTLMIEPQVQQP
jgi:copper(I)-binding protein